MMRDLYTCTIFGWSNIHNKSYDMYIVIACVKNIEYTV
jgi:hypothetical protein